MTPEGAVEAAKYSTPPESSVILAAKHRFARTDTRNWDDQAPEEREGLIDSTRLIISHGPLLTKAKYLAKIGATAWDQLYPEAAK